MINLETILSLYDGKPTLMQWLKKVEKALADSTLVGFSYDEVSPRHIKLVLTFEDGSILETPVIELPQDYSVSNIELIDGELVFTMTNGNVINVGSIGAVSGFSINASQHLIVTYQDGTSQDLGAIFAGNVSISGNLSATGDISPLENIVDSQGRKRFIEGALSDPQVSGITRAYARWSLSGTHLMVVVAGNLAANTSLTFGTSLGAAVVPQWIADKIAPLISNKAMVAEQTFVRPGGSIERKNVALAKYLNSLIVEVYGTISFNEDTTFRMQFDLLIDAQ